MKENHERRETIVIGVHKFCWLVKQALNSTNRKAHHGPKRICLCINIGNNSCLRKNKASNSKKYNSP
jgi:hypothetical protein